MVHFFYFIKCLFELRCKSGPSAVVVTMLLMSPVTKRILFHYVLSWNLLLLKKPGDLSYGASLLWSAHWVSLAFAHVTLPFVISCKWLVAFRRLIRFKMNILKTVSMWWCDVPCGGVTSSCRFLCDVSSPCWSINGSINSLWMILFYQSLFIY